MQSFFQKMFGVKVEYFQYRAGWLERKNGSLTAIYGQFTNHDNAMTQMRQKLADKLEAWLEDENGRIIRGV